MTSKTPSPRRSPSSVMGMRASATGTTAPSRLASGSMRSESRSVPGSGRFALLERLAAGRDPVHARPVGERLGLERAGEDVALAHVAAQLGQAADDVGRLGALG